jgi:alpha-L-fucosidase
LGQRIDSVKVDVWANGSWKPLASATSIGANRLIKLAEPVRATKLRVHLYAPVAPTLSDFALFKEAKSDFKFDQADRKKIAKDQLNIISGDKHSKKAVDNDDKTVWETILSSQKFVEIRLPKTELITGMSYMPRQDRKIKGVPSKYEIQTSIDGKEWKTVASGEFSNIRANATEQSITFDTAQEAHYIRFIPNEVLSEDKEFSVAEFDVYLK